MLKKKIYEAALLVEQRRPLNFVTYDHCLRDHIVIVAVTADPHRQHFQCRRRPRPRHRRGRRRFVVVTVSRHSYVVRLRHQSTSAQATASLVQSLLFLIIIWQAPRAGKLNQILRCDWLPERAR